MKVKKSKILNDKTIAAAFLTIGLWITIKLLLNLLGDWEKLFSAIGDIGSVVIGTGMFYLGWQQHKHLEQKISKEDKKDIRQHYNDLTEVLRLIISRKAEIGEGNERNKILAKLDADIWKLLTDARILGMGEVEELVESVQKRFWEYRTEARSRETTEKGGLPVGLERSRVFKNWESFHKFIRNLQLEEKYSKFLKLPTKTYEN